MTIRRVIKKFGLRRRIAARRTLMNEVQRNKRRNWSQSRKKLPISYWARVLFSDEKIFRTDSHRRGVFVTRRVNEKFEKKCVQLGPKRGPQIHVWGLIGWRGVGPIKLVNGRLDAREYQKQILSDLKEVGAKMCSKKQKGWIFQQDLAPPHSARSTTEFLANKNISVLEWPGNSPDLNPIEHVWGYLAQKLDGLPMATTNNMLWEQVQAAWHTIPVSYLRQLYRSMPRRISAVLESEGGFTSY